MPLWVPLTRLSYSYSLGGGSRDRDRDQWKKVMSTGPLSDTFPGNLAGAAALWRPRQRGSRWSQDAPVGVGLSAGAVSPTARQGLLRAGLGFPVGFLSLCLYQTHLTHREHTSVVLVAELWPLQRAVGLLAQCGGCLSSTEPAWVP